ncbi:MAG: hypothetical protein PHQ32_03680 [Firmicutes bacterium]|nr:hypothetical protein [Bacillota bacterium]
MKKITKILLTAFVFILLSGTAVMAGTTSTSYLTVVAKLNGNGYTGYQTKAYTGNSGVLYSGSVGGGYVIDARMEGSSDAAWIRDVNDNQTRTLPSNSYQYAGNSYRVQFSNDWNTLVDVLVSGSWKSN